MMEDGWTWRTGPRGPSKKHLLVVLRLSQRRKRKKEPTSVGVLAKAEDGRGCQHRLVEVELLPVVWVEADRLDAFRLLGRDGFVHQGVSGLLRHRWHGRLRRLHHGRHRRHRGAQGAKVTADPPILDAQAELFVHSFVGSAAEQHSFVGSAAEPASPPKQARD